MNDRSKAPTINDVAEMAGVSKRTVSRVINGEAHVHPRTHKRIMDAIEEFGSP